jgi:hypothetical protein
VLKPGGHVCVFGGSRTYDLMVMSLRLAGFEIRDCITWNFGSGFPKSLNVSKAIDKAAGAEREVLRTRPGGLRPGHQNGSGGNFANNSGGGLPDIVDTAPATDAAKQWEGWGTALKPAHEPIVLARKPLIGTVAANVLTHGTGALNIDGTRVGMSGADAERSANNWKPQGYDSGENIYNLGTKVIATEQNPTGRWPANVIFDTEAGALLDEQTDGASRFFTAIDWDDNTDLGIDVPFRYVPKPSKRERNAGLDGLPERDWREGAKNSTPRSGQIYEQNGRIGAARANHHPTVKPLALMRWLVRLVTPPGGTVLEPFAGSGTTLMACVMEGFNGIGIELTDEYLPIIEGRVKWAHDNQPTQEQLPL